MNDMIKELYSIGLIPVIKIENAEDAVPLAKALIDGGLPLQRSPSELPALLKQSRELPMLIPRCL